MSRGGLRRSRRHDILHFATHAELSEDDPLASAILLAKSDKEGGRLEVRNLFGMDLKAHLVVVSGCETGLGKLSTGDELVGLTRAFIHAGMRSVVASLWKSVTHHQDDCSQGSLGDRNQVNFSMNGSTLIPDLNMRRVGPRTVRSR